MLACGRHAPGFLKLNLCKSSVCVYVCLRVCVCLPSRLLITSGVIYTPYDWLNKFYSCYMANVVIIVNGRGLGIDARRTYIKLFCGVSMPRDDIQLMQKMVRCIKLIVEWIS